MLAERFLEPPFTLFVSIEFSGWGLREAIAIGAVLAMTDGVVMTLMRLDWTADPAQVPEFCVVPVTSSLFSGWLRLEKKVLDKLQLEIIGGTSLAFFPASEMGDDLLSQGYFAGKC